MLLISRRESEALLDMREAIETLESAFARYGEGGCSVPVRLNMGLGDKDALGLYMPSYLAPGGAHTAALGVKIVTLFADNPARGLPYIIGVFLLQDPNTGAPLAIGILSVVAVLTLPRWPYMSGLVYFLMGPLHGLNGWWTGKKVERAASGR